jgi:hypothetical protein
VAGGQRLGGDRPIVRIERNVDDGGDRENVLAGQERHDQTRQWTQQRRTGVKLSLGHW